MNVVIATAQLIRGNFAHIEIMIMYQDYPMETSHFPLCKWHSSSPSRDEGAKQLCGVVIILWNISKWHFFFRPQRRNSQKQPEAEKGNLRSNQRAVKVSVFLAEHMWSVGYCCFFFWNIFDKSPTLFFLLCRKINCARTQNKWLFWCKLSVRCPMFHIEIKGGENNVCSISLCSTSVA